MSVWQYAQLTVTIDARSQESTRTVLWHGPGPGPADGLGGSEQTMLDVLNQLGADGWELAGVEEDRQGGNRGTDWGATWSLTTYTFKRPVSELNAV
jgi:hypothetical protein